MATASFSGLLQQFGIDSSGNVSSTGSLTVATSTFNAPMTASAGALSTTTMGTATTLSENDLLNYEYWNVNPNVVADRTFTLPASSTLANFIPSTGDRRSVYVKLSSTTAASTTESLFATSAGIDIESSTSTNRVGKRNSA